MVEFGTGSTCGDGTIDEITDTVDKVPRPCLVTHLKCGPGKAIDDQTSPVRHIRVEYDIQERVTNLHGAMCQARMSQSASHVVIGSLGLVHRGKLQHSQLRHIRSTSHSLLLHAGKGITQCL